MKTLLAALAALLLAAPAAAATRGLVVVYPSTSSVLAHVEPQRMFQGVLDSFGAEYDVVPYTALMTEWARTGKVPVGAHAVANGSPYSELRSYQWVAHVGVHKNQVPLGACRWDSLLLGARWPTVHQIFIGAAATGSNKWTDGGGVCGACSTGIGSNIGSGANTLNAMLYRPGSPRAWGPGINLAVRNAAGPPGIWRPLVGVGARNLELYTNNPEPDTPVMQAVPDSVVAWERRGKDAQNRGTGARLIFINYTAAVGSDADPAMGALAVAAIDSALGGTVIKRTVKAAVVIDRWFAMGSYNFNVGRDSVTAGLFHGVVADSSDSTNVKATMDSLNTLGIPITFAVDPDSADFYAWQNRAMQRVALYRVTPQVWAGCYPFVTGTNNGSGNASKARYRDIFGHTRHRSLLPPGATSFSPSCPESDSSLSCQLRWAFQECETRWPGRLDRVIQAPFDDWTPRYINRARASGWDSLTATLYAAGAKGVRVNSYNSIDGDAGRNANPSGWSTGLARWPVYAVAWDSTMRAPLSGGVVDYFESIPTRGSEFSGNAQRHHYDGVSHKSLEEFLHGLFQGNWYMPHQVFSVSGHNMQVRTRILKLSAHCFGGTGPGTRASRPHWYTVKYIANSFEAANKYAGRTVCLMTTPEDVASEPVR